MPRFSPDPIPGGGDFEYGQMSTPILDNDGANKAYVDSRQLALPNDYYIFSDVPSDVMQLTGDRQYAFRIFNYSATDSRVLNETHFQIQGQPASEIRTNNDASTTSDVVPAGRVVTFYVQWSATTVTDIQNNLSPSTTITDVRIDISDTLQIRAATGSDVSGTTGGATINGETGNWTISLGSTASINNATRTIVIPNVAGSGGGIRLFTANTEYTAGMGFFTSDDSTLFPVEDSRNRIYRVRVTFTSGTTLTQSEITSNLTLIGEAGGSDITVTSTSVTDGTNTFNKYTDSEARTAVVDDSALAGTADTGATNQAPSIQATNDALAGKQDDLTSAQLEVVNARPFTTADETKLDGINVNAGGTQVTDGTNTLTKYTNAEADTRINLLTEAWALLSNPSTPIPDSKLSTAALERIRSVTLNGSTIELYYANVTTGTPDFTIPLSSILRPEVRRYANINARNSDMTLTSFVYARVLDDTGDGSANPQGTRAVYLLQNLPTDVASAGTDNDDWERITNPDTILNTVENCIWRPYLDTDGNPSRNPADSSRTNPAADARGYVTVESGELSRGDTIDRPTADITYLRVDLLNNEQNVITIPAVAEHARSVIRAADAHSIGYPQFGGWAIETLGGVTNRQTDTFSWPTTGGVFVLGETSSFSYLPGNTNRGTALTDIPGQITQTTGGNLSLTDTRVDVDIYVSSVSSSGVTPTVVFTLPGSSETVATTNNAPYTVAFPRITTPGRYTAFANLATTGLSSSTWTNNRPMGIHLSKPADDVGDFIYNVNSVRFSRSLQDFSRSGGGSGVGRFQDLTDVDIISSTDFIEPRFNGRLLNEATFAPFGTNFNTNTNVFRMTIRPDSDFQESELLLDFPANANVVWESDISTLFNTDITGSVGSSEATGSGVIVDINIITGMDQFVEGLTVNGISWSEDTGVLGFPASTSFTDAQQSEFFQGLMTGIEIQRNRTVTPQFFLYDSNDNEVTVTDAADYRDALQTQPRSDRLSVATQFPTSAGIGTESRENQIPTVRGLDQFLANSNNRSLFEEVSTVDLFSFAGWVVRFATAPQALYAWRPNAAALAANEPRSGGQYTLIGGDVRTTTTTSTDPNGDGVTLASTGNSIFIFNQATSQMWWWNASPGEWVLVGGSGPFEGYTITGTPSLVNAVPKWTAANTLAWSTDDGGSSGSDTFTLYNSNQHWYRVGGFNGIDTQDGAVGFYTAGVDYSTNPSSISIASTALTLGSVHDFLISDDDLADTDIAPILNGVQVGNEIVISAGGNGYRLKVTSDIIELDETGNPSGQTEVVAAAMSARVIEVLGTGLIPNQSSGANLSLTIVDTSGITANTLTINGTAFDGRTAVDLSLPRLIPVYFDLAENGDAQNLSLDLASEDTHYSLVRSDSYGIGFDVFNSNGTLTSNAAASLNALRDNGRVVFLSLSTDTTFTLTADAVEALDLDFSSTNVPQIGGNNIATVNQISTSPAGRLFSTAQSYQNGDIVSHNGVTWIANRNLSTTPIPVADAPGGTNNSWAQGTDPGFNSVTIDSAFRLQETTETGGTIPGDPNGQTATTTDAVITSNALFLNIPTGATLNAGTDYIWCVSAVSGPLASRTPIGVYLINWVGGTGNSARMNNIRPVTNGVVGSAIDLSTGAGSSSITYRFHAVGTGTGADFFELQNVTSSTNVVRIPDTGDNVNRADFVGLPTVAGEPLATQEWVQTSNLSSINLTSPDGTQTATLQLDNTGALRISGATQVIAVDFVNDPTPAS